MTQEQKTYHAQRDAVHYWQTKGASVLLLGGDYGRFSLVVDLPATVTERKARELVEASGADAKWKQVRGSRLDICYVVK